MMTNKNLRTLTAASLAATLALSGCQDPVARQEIDLSGTWQTEIGTVRLPGTTDESQRGDSLSSRTETSRLSRKFSFVGPLTYTRTITVPDSWAGLHKELIIEKTKPSTLWIDGDSLGSHTHLHTPHVYDVSALTPGPHTICLRIDNGPDAILPQIGGSHAVTEATQTNWNGMLGRLCLEATQPTYIQDIRVDAQTAVVNVTATVFSDKDQDVLMISRCQNTDYKHSRNINKFHAQLRKGENKVPIQFTVGDPVLWSEHNRALYLFELKMITDDGYDKAQTTFGIRSFATAGQQFLINGQPTFLRGKHDACVFPLTGYAPMDKEAWLRVFRTAKEYGINHYRFHSWTPPAAAFEAADEEGIYLQPELPYWGEIKPDSASAESARLNTFLRREAELICREFGNHPSFVMMALGNELCGSQQEMTAWVDSLRAHDTRHLYAYGSNNNLGWRGAQEGEDFLVTCRVGGEMPGKYNTHVRASFSYADAADGGIINGTYPNTRMDFAQAASAAPMPVISHESGQFQIYPDYAEIDKYTGVLAPCNLECFRDGLKQNRLDSLADRFHIASGSLAVACYKADIEMCLRTRRFGGFQLLDLQDYPGQGSALVGILDAFMDSKGLVAPETFRGFCSDLVPLALMDRLTFTTADTLAADIAVANYSAETLHNATLRWSLCRPGHATPLADGGLSADAMVGDVNNFGTLRLPLATLPAPSQLLLTLNIDGRENAYKVWVYPAQNTTAKTAAAKARQAGVKSAERLTPAIVKEIEQGAAYVIVPQHADIAQQSVGGMFISDYWNYAMFKSISESIGKPVSPGTLGYLVNNHHPIMRQFPSDIYSDMQWWAIAKNSRPLILDGTPYALKPMVMAIDNVNRNHKLGVLFEARVGQGRVIVCTTNLKAIAHVPEGRQYADAIYNYAASDAFNPSFEMTGQELLGLFSNKKKTEDIEGVKNISDYSQK